MNIVRTTFVGLCHRSCSSEKIRTYNYMKKTFLLSLFLLPFDIASAELSFKEGNGGVASVEAGSVYTAENSIYSEYNVSGKGGVFYVEKNAQLALSGTLGFLDNYHNAEVEEGIPYGDTNDVYLEDGATLTATATIESELYVEEVGGIYYSIYRNGGDAMSFSGFSISSSTVSGSVTGADISVEGAASFNDLSLTSTIIWAESGSASGITLDAASSLNGAVLLSGNNAVILEGWESWQLADVTLADGASLVFTLTPEQLESMGNELTITLGALSLQGEATFAVANDGLQVTGYSVEVDAGGNKSVVVTVAAVPEPTTATLSLLALAALAARRRRRA